MRKILFFVNNYWTSPYQVGSHHIAKMFLKDGWQVLYISDPVSPMHIFRWREFKDKLKILLKPIRKDRLTATLPFCPFPPKHRSFGFMFDRWINMTIPNLVRFIRKMGFQKPDVLFIKSALFQRMLDELDYGISVYRVADFNPAFPDYPEFLAEREVEIIKKVDVVLSSGLATIYDYINKHRKENVYYLPNGVEFDRFALSSSAEPDDIKAIPKPRAVYVGAVGEWFDEKLLKFTIERMKNVSFIVIGSAKKKSVLKMAERYSNLHLLGRRNYELIPAYLQSSDVGLMFQETSIPMTHYFNPLKMYQYLASGLPVVSKRWKNLEYLKAPIFLADTEEEFVNQIKNALSVSEKDKKRFVEFAREYDWNRIFDKLKSILHI